MGSSLVGGTLWGGAAGAGAAGAGAVLDVVNSIADAAYRLGFQSLADLETTGAYVTVAELYQFASDAAQRLAYVTAAYLTLDTSITVVAGTPTYALPAAHVYTVAAALANALLRLTPVRDLWALDGNWPTTSGSAQRVSYDAGGVGTVTVYPNPITGGVLQQVCQEAPATVAAGASTLPLPTVLQDYFTYAMLAGGRGKESDSAMPEMAKHYQGRMRLYEQVIEKLYGPGQ